MSELHPVFNDEVQLAGWSETHNGGAKVTLWLSDSKALDAFRDMTVAKGKQAGQRLACVMVLIGDDENPEAPPQCDTNKPKGGALARLAGQWCNNKVFWEWANRQIVPDTHDTTWHVSNPSEAANFIRGMCRVNSRAELDSNERAADYFHTNIREPFSEYLAKNTKPLPLRQK